MAENRELALVLKLVADEFKNELRASQGALSGFNTFLKDWRTQLTAAGTALFAVAKSTANFGEEALKGAQKAGTTVETYTALGHAANMADLDNHQLTIGLKELSQSIAEASRGSGEGAKLFASLGVSATTSTGQVRPTVEVLLDLAETFSKMPDGALKADAAVRGFGKAGLEMIPFLNQGKAGIAELMREAQRLGVVMSKDTAIAASKFNDEIKKLEASAQGFKLAIGKELIGPLTQLMQSMGDAATGPVSKVFKIEMQGLASIFTLLGHGLQEVSMELDIFFKKMGASASVKKFWDDVLVQSRKNLDRQTDKRLHQIFQDQLGAVGGGSPAGPETGGRHVFMGDTKAVLVDQEKLGKAKLEIFLAQNRALEIQAKLAREAAAAPNEYFLAFDRKQQFEKEDAAAEERKGRMIVERTQTEVRLRDQAAGSERAALLQNVQAWIDYDNQVGASTQLRYDHQMDLLRANLANQLQLTTEETGRLLIAWQNHDSQLQDQILSRTALTSQERETVELQSLTKLAKIHEQYNGTIFEGWSRGLEQYVRNTDSAFGFAAQMAQRTAQFMEGSFRTFFFDVMDGKVKSMKDLFLSFGNFVKQIIAQIMAQLAVALAMKGLTSAFGGGGALFGGLLGVGGRNVSGIDVGAMKFASGGMVLGAGNQDTVRALLTPGEGVLNRKGMQALGQLNAGAVPSSSEGNVTVNIHNSGRTDAPQVNYRRQMKGMIIDIIYRDPDLRHMMGGRA